MQINYDSALLAVKREVSRLYYDQQEEELTLRVATVLMASLLVGANRQVLADFTHFELSFIKPIAERLQSVQLARTLPKPMHCLMYGALRAAHCLCHPTVAWLLASIGSFS